MFVSSLYKILFGSTIYQSSVCDGKMGSFRPDTMTCSGLRVQCILCHYGPRFTTEVWDPTFPSRLFCFDYLLFTSFSIVKITEMDVSLHERLLVRSIELSIVTNSCVLSDTHTFHIT